MHIADPNARDLRGQRDRRPPACRSRSGAATAAQLRADGSVAVAFFGDGAVAQGAFHEAVNLAAVWRLPVVFFCENNGYAEFSAGVGAARGAARAPGRRLRRRLRRRRRQRRRGHRVGHGRGGRRRPGRAAARPSSRRPPTGGTATTRATRSATGRPRSCRSGSERDPLVVHAARLRAAGVADDAIAVARGVGRRRSSTPPSTPPGRWPSPAPVDAVRLRGPPAARRCPSRRRPPTTRRCSARWTPSAPRSKPSWTPTSGCSSPGSTSATAATSSGSRRGLRDRFGDRVRDTPISETAIMGLGVGAAMAGHAAGGRADVPRLRRRVPRPAAQPGGEAAVHDRRRRRRWR